MQQPLVSICIPTHNRLKLLKEAVKSAINQTYKNIEIIISDNSDDNLTNYYVKTIQDKRIRYHKNTSKNISAFQNVDKIAHLAKGKYISFLDSDDAWYSNKLEKVIAVLYRYPDIDILSHDLLMVRNNNKKKVLRVGPLSKDMYVALLFKNRRGTD